MRASKVKIDTRAIEDGRWIAVGGAYDDLRILTRGFTDEFRDAQKTKNKTATDAFMCTVEEIPEASLRRINAELLRDYLILDVENFLDDDDKPIPVNIFHEMLFEKQWTRLARACWTSASRVTVLSKEQLESAEGNSGAASVSISQTPATASE